MAFNPFHRFRKHQKVIFAALTILCMLTFVLSSSIVGIGDLFSDLPYWFGGTSARNPVIATVYGQDVRNQELQRLYVRRLMANRYMDAATQRAHQRQLLDGMTAIGKWQDKAKQQQAQQALSYWFQGSPQYGDQLLENLEMTLERENKMAEAAQLQSLRTALVKNYIAAHRNDQMFFGASGERNTEQLVDFIIWRHEADRLGIQLTPEGVGHLVSQELDKQLLNSDLAQIEQNLRHEYGLNPDEFLSSLTDEFRVRLAKSALLGHDPGSFQVREGIPPYEVWQWYRENFTWGNYTLLPVPVDQQEFLSKVGQPDEKELKEFFEKHKNLPYNPAAEEAGFQQPPRIGVEWVSARTDAPQFRQAVATTLAAMQATMPVAYDAWLYDQYETLKWRLFKNPSWTQDTDIFQQTSLREPANVAALVGQLVGGGGAQVPVYAAAIGYEGGVLAREMKERLEVGTALWLSLSNPTPFTAAALGHVIGKRPEFVPFEQVKALVLQRAEEDVARKFVDQTLADFRERLENLSKIQTPAEARSFLQANRPETVAGILALVGGSAASVGPAHLSLIGPAAVASVDSNANGIRSAVAWLAALTPLSPPGGQLPYLDMLLPRVVLREALDPDIRKEGLIHGTTQKPDDYFDIAKDPGLQPLAEAYPRAFERFQNPAGDKFDQLFFNAKTFQPAMANAYNPRPLTTEDGSFLYWMTAEEPAYTPTYGEVVDKVKARWRLEKARKFAEEQAEAIAKQAREAKGDPLRVLRDVSFNHPSWGSLVELDHVAPLQKHPIPQATTMPMMEYGPYQVSSRVEYPSADFVNKLLQLKQKGDVTIVSDKPQTTYYVAALVTDRSSPPENSFYQDFAVPAQRQQMLAKLEETNKYPAQQREAVMQRLRELAKVRIVKQDKKEEPTDQPQ